MTDVGDILKKVSKAKNEYIMGDDILDLLTEIEQALIKIRTDRKELGKMSKSKDN